MRGPVKTSFHKIWNDESLSTDNKTFVQKQVLDKYREFGFNVEKTSVDCGWDKHYFALKFKEIDKVLKEETS